MIVRSRFKMDVVPIHTVHFLYAHTLEGLLTCSRFASARAMSRIGQQAAVAAAAAARSGARKKLDRRREEKKLRRAQNDVIVVGEGR